MRLSIPLAGLLAASLAAGARTAEALTHEVGPGKTYANVGDVPWESLNAGDTVLIHHRATPYKEKFVLSRVGTPSAPITVRGVLGPLGERPVLDGNGATTRPQLDYYSRNRGVIKIGGSTAPFADGITVMPQWIVIENLEIRSARPPYSFTGPSGAVENYPNNASTIYLEFGENVTVRNCVLHDSGNGFFAFSSDQVATRNVLLEGNYIFDNGNTGSNFEHNVYTEATTSRIARRAWSSATTGSRAETASSTSSMPRTARSCATTPATAPRSFTATWSSSIPTAATTTSSSTAGTAAAPTSSGRERSTSTTIRSCPTARIGPASSA